MVIADCKRMPHSIDGLLEDANHATEVNKTEMCRHTPLSLSFVRKYDTVKKLQSKDCRNKVFVKAYLHQRASVLIESRMATIRSFVKQRQQTWRKRFVDINAEFTLQGHRSMENDGELGSSTRCVFDAPVGTGETKRRKRGTFVLSIKPAEEGTAGPRSASFLKRCMQHGLTKLNQARPKNKS